MKQDLGAYLISGGALLPRAPRGYGPAHTLLKLQLPLQAPVLEQNLIDNKT